MLRTSRELALGREGRPPAWRASSNLPAVQARETKPAPIYGPDGNAITVLATGAGGRDSGRRP